MSKPIFLFLLLYLLSFQGISQVAVNTSGETADSSAILDIKSKEKGLLIPRMTTNEISFIQNPANGLIIYNTDEECLYIYVEGTGKWKEVALDTGEITPFSCGDSFLDDRDNKEYATVKIGTQCWMQEPLDVGVKINHTQDPSDNDTIEKYCVGNNTSNCDTYGALYQWSEMMLYGATEGSQGICPSGWHIPSDEDWKKLEGFVDTQYGVGDPEWDLTGWRGLDAGGNLKESGTTHWVSPNTGATNSSGFTALPVGLRYSDGSGFAPLGYGVLSWTSTPDGANAYGRDINWEKATIKRGSYSTQNGFSVRCLKNTDVEDMPPVSPSNPSPEDGSHFQSIYSDLSWDACTDPEGDPVFYNVYFGESSDPPLVASNISSNSYDPDTLDQGSTYHWKVVAMDYSHQIEGPTWSFTTCGENLVDSRDSQSYETVQIGDQCWMAENINIGDTIFGSSIPTNNGIIEKTCYGNNLSNCNNYGGLYAWDELMQYTTQPGAQGICPSGWHIPTDEEWKTLEGSVDSQYGVGDPEWDGTGYRGHDAGMNLKSDSGWWANTGTDIFGFTALPGGRGSPSGSYIGMGEYGQWWTSTQNGSFAWNRQMDYDNDGIDRDDNNKLYSRSVRCLFD